MRKELSKWAGSVAVAALAVPTASIAGTYDFTIGETTVNVSGTEKKFGETADLARDEGEDSDSLSFVAGLRLSF